MKTIVIRTTGRGLLAAALLLAVGAFVTAGSGSGVLDDDGHLAPGAAPPPDSKEDREVEKLLRGRFVDSVSVDMVMVPAVVEDRKGRPVLDLDRQDFTLLEEGRVQEIEYFSLDRNQPVSIAFVLDVSGSMRMSGRIVTAKEAVRYFLGSLRSADQAALIAFADRQVAVLNEFGTDRRETLKWLDAVRAYGQTALNDAVAAIPSLVDRSHRGRKAIVLITDGVDNYSTLTLRQAMAAAAGVDVPIYAIGFSAQSRDLMGKRAAATEGSRALAGLSEETGGMFYEIHDPDDMKEAVSGIEEDLRSQYVLGYTPRNARRDGRFRRISLIAGKGRYTVRTRTGYVLDP